MSAEHSAILAFAGYTLDLRHRQLWKGNESIRIEPQPFELLELLAEHAGENVTREKICERLWGKHTHVHDASGINRCIRKIRAALGDDARAPRFVLTLRGGGYRFIAPVTKRRGRPPGLPRSSTPAEGRRNRATPVTGHGLVGREAELEVLRSHFDGVCERNGRVVAIAGEAGFGKTALAEEFVRQLQMEGRKARLAMAACAPHAAGSEAYLPLINALEFLITGDPAEELLEWMGQTAPIWRAQVKPSAESAVRSAPPERIKRQFVAFLRHVSDETPVVLLLEDLHWADRSTIELLAYLGTQLRELPALVLVTFRASQMLREQHPFVRVKEELEGHQLYHEVLLGRLSQPAVHRYIEQRFPDNKFPAWFAPLIFRKTEGHPLFLINQLQDFLQQQIVIDDAGWRLTASMSEAANRIPDSVNSLIDARLLRLAEPDQALLRAASVQGVDFDSTVVADALARLQVEVEERLQRLESTEALIAFRGESELPDRSLGGGYRFSHALYQAALFDSLTPAGKVELSGKVAQSLLNRYGNESFRIAPQLASLLTSARRFHEALPYYLTAARNAAQLSAFFEVNEFVDRGLALARELGAGTEPARWELELLTLKGVSTMALEGFSAQQIETIYARGKEIVPKPKRDPRFGPLIHMFWAYCSSNGKLDVGLELAHELVALARSAGDPGLSVNAYFALGVTFLHQGELAKARRELQRASSFPYDPALRERNPYFEHLDPWVASRCNCARASALLGLGDEALSLVRSAQQLADEIGHVKTIAYTSVFRADVHHFRGEADEALAASEKALGLAAEHGLFQEYIWASALRAWALTQQGEAQRAVGEFRKHVESYRGPAATKFLGMMADALAAAGEMDQARAVLDAAIDLADRTGERYYEAELYRLKGDLFLRPGSRRRARGLAERYFRRAAALAEAQKAVLLKLRAQASLDSVLSR